MVEGSGDRWAASYNSTHDTKDTSKIEEYHDLGNGALSNIFVRGRNDRTWFDGYGENFGRDDQYLMLRGGHVRSLQVQHLHELAAAQLPVRRPDAVHRGGFGTTHHDVPAAESVARGTRSTSATSARTPAASSSGRGTRRGISASTAIRSSSTAPRSARAPTAPAPATASPISIFPTQYKTKNASAEGGYSSGNLTASLSYLYSKFENDLQTFTWNNAFFNNNVDTTYLAPRQPVSADRGQPHVPRPAVEFDVRGTLHVAGNEE